MPGEQPATRDLAYRWLAAVRRGGVSAPEALALTTPGFRLNLPRSLAPIVEGAGLDLPRDRLGEIDRAVRQAFDVEGCGVVRKGYDIFQGDRGGLQADLSLRTAQGEALEVQFAVTFERAADKLAAVWAHLDTAELKRALVGA